MSSLKDLQALGVFIEDELVQHEIKFVLEEGGEEQTATVHVRRLSIGSQEEIFLGGGDAAKSRTAKMISEAIRLGEKGEEKLSFIDAYKLHPAVAVAMVKAIGEVSGSRRKNLQPPSDSSTT